MLVKQIITKAIHLLIAGGFLFLIPFQSFSQSGWTKGKGEIFGKISYQTFQSDEYFTLSGVRLNTTEFSQRCIGVYGEYGITDELTLIVDWPAFKSQKFETTETITGIGDLKLGLKYRLPVKFPITISVIPELPIGPANSFASNKIIADDVINLPTGDGEFNLYTILAASHSFDPIPIYINAYIAHNLRTEYEGISLGNQLMEGIEVGGQPIKNIWIKGGLMLQQTYQAPEGVVSFVRGDGTEFTSWTAGLYYQFSKNWGVDANVIGYLERQGLKNIYSGTVFAFGVVYDLKK